MVTLMRRPFKRDWMVFAHNVSLENKNTNTNTNTNTSAITPTAVVSVTDHDRIVPSTFV